MQPTVSDFLVSRLREWGVERLYGYSGDGINGVMSALRRADGNPRLILAARFGSGLTRTKQQARPLPESTGDNCGETIEPAQTRLCVGERGESPVKQLRPTFADRGAIGN